MFDIFVGTSVGSAMAAGFAKTSRPNDLERGTHEIFVRRPQLPAADLAALRAAGSQGVRCALADQYGRALPDRGLLAAVRGGIATNLSTHNLELIRTGLLWQAVRASSAIPDCCRRSTRRDGAMLVDGCLIDNVPLAPMHQLKSGPNLVVHFGEPAAEMFDVDYAALPGRLGADRGDADCRSARSCFRRRRARSTCCGEASWRISATTRCRPAPLDRGDAARRSLPGVDVTDFDLHTEIFARVLSLGPRGHRCAGGGGQFRQLRRSSPPPIRATRRSCHRGRLVQTRCSAEPRHTTA